CWSRSLLMPDIHLCDPALDESQQLPCQSTLTTESAERNHCFDFPLATERNHRPQRGPADGPLTAKYP
ncbi:hypothetical protein JOQ06_027472, partial [Pogonophryne albipinna]